LKFGRTGALLREATSENSGAIAIGFAAAGVIAFAQVHSQQLTASGFPGPRRKQTLEQIDQPTHMRGSHFCRCFAFTQQRFTAMSG